MKRRSYLGTRLLVNYGPEIIWTCPCPHQYDAIQTHGRHFTQWCHATVVIKTSFPRIEDLYINSPDWLIVLGALRGI